ncbi:MAG: glycosyltransferase family 39 protein, partial [Dysgonamonadaceae bacterium]|nr:glycosyltransferase family 39 protein [Dysgonamonadaceae bacterium]
MKRKIASTLIEREENNSRKPLIVNGVRGIGKTCIISEFGKRYAALVAVLFLLNGLVYFYYGNNTCLTDGTYVYPLDDTYIHLSIAKNVALNNNWGVVHDKFCSTSSAPVYTLILSAVIALFGDSAIYPLLINIFFGNCIIILLFWFFRKNWLAFSCASLFLFTPVMLHIQILGGMEHTLHIFLILAAFMLLYKYLKNKHKKYVFLFLPVAGLLCLTRYESMFFMVPVIFVLVLHRQYKLAAATFVAGFLPVLIFGLYSIRMGGFFFPNSLLMKGDMPFSNGIFFMLKHYAEKIYRNIFPLSFLIVPIAILSYMLIRTFIANKQYNLQGLNIMIKKYSFVFIVFVTILLHGLFADFGWLYRYEAYLLSLLYVSFVVAAVENIKIVKCRFKKRIPSLVSIIFLFVIFSHLTIRSALSHKIMRQAGKNVYDQQIQMSRFLHIYHNESKVMANDIGAITYYTNIDLLDLVGLGSTSVIKYRKEGGDIKKLVTQYPYNQYHVILIYDLWLDIKRKDDYERLGWIKAGELKIENNLVCGSDAVSFYTSEPAMADELRGNLLRFKDMVP